MIRRPPRSTPFPTRRSSDLGSTSAQNVKDKFAKQAQLQQERNYSSCVDRVLGKRSEEHTSELQSRQYLVCRLLLEKKKVQHRHSDLDTQQYHRVNHSERARA